MKLVIGMTLIEENPLKLCLFGKKKSVSSHHDRCAKSLQAEELTRWIQAQRKPYANEVGIFSLPRNGQKEKRGIWREEGHLKNTIKSGRINFVVEGVGFSWPLTCEALPARGDEVRISGRCERVSCS